MLTDNVRILSSSRHKNSYTKRKSPCNIIDDNKNGIRKNNSYDFGLIKIAVASSYRYTNVENDINVHDSSNILYTLKTPINAVLYQDHTHFSI